MRKHPLIALTAFTAFGTSAVAAGATTGGPVSTHSSIRSIHQHSSQTSFASYDRGRRESARLLARTMSTRAARRLARRSKVAMHDATLDDWARLEINSRTGLVVPPHSHTKARSHARAKAAPPPAPASAPAPAPVFVSAPPTTTTPPAPTAPSGGVWYELRMCESGGNYAENSGNGYYGAYQFSLATWYGLGYSGLPSDAPPATQDQAAQELQARSGWGQWPSCAAQLGLI